MESKTKEAWGTSIIWGTTFALVGQIALLTRSFHLDMWLRIGVAALVVGTPIVIWRRLRLRSEGWGLDFCWGITSSLVAWAAFGLLQGARPFYDLVGFTFFLMLFSAPVVIWRRMPNAEVPWRTCLSWGLTSFAVLCFLMGATDHSHTTQMWTQDAPMALPTGLFAFFIRRRTPLITGLGFREWMSILFNPRVRQRKVEASKTEPR